MNGRKPIVAIQIVGNKDSTEVRGLTQSPRGTRVIAYVYTIPMASMMPEVRKESIQAAITAVFNQEAPPI